jgi:multiple sugar transport system permease protein
MRKVFIYGVLILWSFVCVFPVYWLFTVSLKSGYASTEGYVPFADFIPNLDAWRYILFDRSDSLTRQLVNSTVVALASTALTVITAAFALYGFTRFRVPRGDTILFGLLASRALPPIVLIVPLYVLGQRLHLLDTRMLLILIYAAINLPVALWLLRPVFGSKASEQEEAARLDGASHAMILREVVLPAAATGLSAAGVAVFILAWNEYLLAAHLAGAHAMTLPPFLEGQLSIKEAQASFESEELARFSASAILALIPALILARIAQGALGRGAAAMKQ